MSRAGLAALPAELQVEICRTLCRHCRDSDSDRDRDGRDGHATYTTSTPSTTTAARSEPSWASEEHVLQARALADLASLSRTCGALRAAAEPFLYHFVTISSERGVALLARTLAARLELARGISVVSIALPKDESESETGSNRANEAGNGATVPTGFVLDKAAPVLRLVAPNLDALHLLGCSSVTAQFPAALGLGPGSGSESGAPPPALRHLRELSLARSDLTAPSLAHLLAAVGPRLASFHLEISVRWLGRPPGSRPNLSFPEAVRALRPWEGTLRELSIIVERGRAPPYDVFQAESAAAALPRFRAVEAVRYSPGFLSIWPIGLLPSDALMTHFPQLPRFARGIRLWGPFHEIPSYIGMVLKWLLVMYGAGEYPRLRRVEIDDPGDLLSSGLLDETLAAYESAGLDLKVHKWIERSEL